MALNDTDGQYHEILNRLLSAPVRPDRTGTGTQGHFGAQLRFDLTKSFPLLTTKKVFFNHVVSELLWFLKGMTNISYLHEFGNHIWDEWADANGDLGPVYGSQWRSWPHGSLVIDQIANVIQSLRENPSSRRHIVTAWNPSEIDNMALPPCHCFFQFYVRDGKYLDCQMYQRSADWFLGVPFNIASYALLTHIIAKIVGLEAGEFVHSFGDYHLYINHIEQAREQLSRSSMPDLPQLRINAEIGSSADSLYELTPQMFEIVGYAPHPYIKAPIAV